MTLHLSLGADLEAALKAAADRAGEAPDDLARKALLAYMEDLEDYAAAIEAMRDPDSAERIPLSELIARYGLDD